MHQIILKDFKTGMQTVLYSTISALEAHDVCEQKALQIVIDEEGEKYMEKNPWGRTKTTLLKGYNLVKSKNKFIKYTIYEKKPNGVFFSGQTKKLFTVSIVKTPHDFEGEVRENETENLSRESLQTVLFDLITLPKFIQETIVEETLIEEKEKTF